MCLAAGPEKIEAGTLDGVARRKHKLRCNMTVQDMRATTWLLPLIALDLSDWALKRASLPLLSCLAHVSTTCLTRQPDGTGAFRSPMSSDAICIVSSIFGATLEA